MDITASEAAEQKRVTIFFCYAHEDELLLNQLKNHLQPLQRQGLIKLWYDRGYSSRKRMGTRDQKAA